MLRLVDITQQSSYYENTLNIQDHVRTFIHDKFSVGSRSLTQVNWKHPNIIMCWAQITIQCDSSHSHSCWERYKHIKTMFYFTPWTFMYNQNTTTGSHLDFPIISELNRSGSSRTFNQNNPSFSPLTNISNPWLFCSLRFAWLSSKTQNWLLLSGDYSVETRNSIHGVNMCSEFDDSRKGKS